VAGLNIFFYLRETPHTFVEAVVRMIIIYGTDLSDKDLSLSCFPVKLMIKALGQGDTLTRAQSD
jgi:hypothetical protein